MESVLLTHSQIAAGMAGFASVVAAFQRPLPPLQRHRFLTILFSSLLQILGCMVPVWLATIREIGPLFWGVVSGIQLGFSIFLWAILVYPMRKLGASSVIAINKPVTILIHLLAASIMGVLIVNTFIQDVSGFGLYYSSLIGSLAIIFLVFADVAIRDT